MIPPSSGRALLIAAHGELHFRLEDLTFKGADKLLNFLTFKFLKNQSCFWFLVQSIVERSRSNQGFASLIDLVVPSFQLLIAAMSGVLIYLVCLYLLSVCTKKLKRRPRLQMKILSFVFVLFSFLFQQFYINTLSTDTITVDVSGLLHSIELLLNTHRQPCFLDEVGFIQWLLFKFIYRRTVG